MIRTLICAALAFALELWAADLTGTWAGSFEITGPNGERQADRCHLELKQSGTSITGTAGPDKSVQWMIQNGKAEGTRITFEVRPPEGGRLVFDLRLSNHHLDGEARGENRGLTIKAKVHATRMAE